MTRSQVTADRPAATSGCFAKSWLITKTPLAAHGDCSTGTAATISRYVGRVTMETGICDCASRVRVRHTSHKDAGARIRIRLAPRAASSLTVATAANIFPVPGGAANSWKAERARNALPAHSCCWKADGSAFTNDATNVACHARRPRLARSPSSSCSLMPHRPWPWPRQPSLSSAPSLETHPGARGLRHSACENGTRRSSSRSSPPIWLASAHECF
jgi:hypothetical protein